MKILLNSINFPEGPAFDNTGKIWLVEKESGNLISVSQQQVKRHKVGGHPNGIAIDKNNLIWICNSKLNCIQTYDEKNKKVKTIISIVNDTPLKMPNDLTFDDQGNLLFTCPGNSLEDTTGYICCLSNNKVEIIKSNSQYPNGLAFSSEFKHLYVAETGTQIIKRFDWNSETKKLSNEIDFYKTDGVIGPDGIAFDQEGNLYIAVYGSSHIRTVDKNGNFVKDYQLPGKNPTNCALDPNGYLGLIITEAEKGNLIQIPLQSKGIL